MNLLGPVFLLFWVYREYGHWHACVVGLVYNTDSFVPYCWSSHFIVPELGPKTKFAYSSHKAVTEYKEAKAVRVLTIFLLSVLRTTLLMSQFFQSLNQASSLRLLNYYITFISAPHLIIISWLYVQHVKKIFFEFGNTNKCKVNLVLHWYFHANNVLFMFERWDHNQFKPSNLLFSLYNFMFGKKQRKNDHIKYRRW